MLAAILVIAAVAVILLVVQGVSAQRHDSHTSTLPDLSYPPPPSLGSFGDAAIEFFRVAIAKAEGFGAPGAVPTRANNPGDLIIPNWQGQKTGPEGVSVFSSVGEGWNRLRYQLYLIGSQQSKVYSFDMTIADMGNKWTITEPGTWSNTVAQSIGTTTDVTLGDLFQGTAS